MHLRLVLLRLEIAQDGKEHRQRRQPLLPVDDIRLRTLRVFDEHEAPEEVRGQLARRVAFQ
jgi:hypothetical protein